MVGWVYLEGTAVDGWHAVSGRRAVVEEALVAADAHHRGEDGDGGHAGWVGGWMNDKS